MLYRGRPAFVVARDADKLTVQAADGERQRVRDKDLVLLAEGSLSALPAPATGGDFETARAMTAPEPGAPRAYLEWAEFADLVFGASGPSETLACFQEAERGRSFALDSGRPYPLDDDQRAASEKKRLDREREDEARADFLARAARGAIGTDDGRFLSEIEALAYGQSSRSRLAKELGFAETPGAAHAFLLRAGVWTDTVNPWPRRAGCPLSPPRAALPDADSGAAIATAAADKGSGARLDLRHLRSLAIDNEHSQDPDDAVSLDGDTIWVHVADPAALIVPGSPVDIEALERGATLYLPERIVPMLPEAAVPRFGLGLAEQSPALSFGVRLADDASVAVVEVRATLLRVERLTYTAADRLLDGGDTDLAALEAIADRRRRRRVDNGAVEIDIPEVSQHVADGQVRIEAQPRTRSARIVRELMLLAGEAAARWAFERSLPFPFYGQEAPQVAEALRVDPEGAVAPLSVQYQRRRGMRAGMLGPTVSAHRGLGLPFYAQVTSPLRRYQDLLAHYQIRAALAGGALEPLDADEIARRCAAASAAIAPNRQAERDSELFWTAVFLSRNPDWRGTGIVAQVNDADALLYIPALGIETRLRGRNFSPDEEIPLRLSRVSLPEPLLSFSQDR